MAIETDGKRGTTTSYGPRLPNQKHGGQAISSQGPIKVAQWTFDYNDLPDAAAHGLGMVIPANSTIVSAKLLINTAFTSTSTTTDLLIGLQKADGTEIDNDGLVAAAQATQTTIATAGNIITGAGALVGTTIGTAAGELVVAGSDTDLLTGNGTVIVEYIV